MKTCYYYAVLYVIGLAMMLVWAAESYAFMGWPGSPHHGVRIQQNEDAIKKNRYNIDTNRSNVYNNRVRILDNDADIANNAAGINTNSVNIDNNSEAIGNNTVAIDKNSQRLSDLEGLQIKAQIRTMLYENKKMRIETYYEHTISGGSGNELGVSFTFNIGKTYAQKVAEAQMKQIKSNARRLERIEQLLNEVR